MKTLKRIFVIGHPGVGKAYFSKYLAEDLGYRFIDADLGLEHRVGLKIKDIIGESGVTQYYQTQLNIIKCLSNQTAIVAGLDCPLSDLASIKKYTTDACVIWPKTTLETQIRRCGSRHLPLTDDVPYETVLKKLHEERNDLYHQLSDLVIEADEGNVQQDIEAFLAYLKREQIEVTAGQGLTDRDLTFFKFNSDTQVRISEQQAICLKHLAKGLSAKEMAREMGISYRTVEVYIAQLKEKLECDSSKDLITLYHSKH